MTQRTTESSSHGLLGFEKVCEIRLAGADVLLTRRIDVNYTPAVRDIAMTLVKLIVITVLIIISILLFGRFLF